MKNKIIDFIKFSAVYAALLSLIISIVCFGFIIYDYNRISNYYENTNNYLTNIISNVYSINENLLSVGNGLGKLDILSNDGDCIYIGKFLNYPTVNGTYYAQLADGTIIDSGVNTSLISYVNKSIWQCPWGYQYYGH